MSPRARRRIVIFDSMSYIPVNLKIEEIKKGHYRRPTAKGDFINTKKRINLFDIGDEDDHDENSRPSLDNEYKCRLF
jgi:hypothetical protein